MIPQFPLDPTVPEIGALVGHWIVTEHVGGGSNGVVFRVLRSHMSSSNNYALKLAREPGDSRFEREAKLLCQIHHLSVPRFEHSGFWKSPGGRVYPYVVMQWAEGVPLYDWVTEHGLTLRQAMVLLAQVARALEATHEYGLHRDVKGDNVLVSREGRAVLVDYGCCWYPDSRPLTDPPIPPGTDAYRSPQLLRAKDRYERGEAKAHHEFQQADDVYALGVTAYRLLACKYPPQRTRRLSVPKELAERCPELSELVLRMLSEDPEARGRAGEIAEALEQLAKREWPEVDLPWVERSSLQPTDRATRPGPPRGYKLRKLAPRFALAVSPAALVLLLVLLMRSVDEPSGEPRNGVQVGDRPEAGTAGMGERALAAAAAFEVAPMSGQGVAGKVPDNPFKGQKRPPCHRQVEAEINGGCWAPKGGHKAPCAADWYEYEGLCYIPIIPILPERSPTTEDPK